MALRSKRPSIFGGKELRTQEVLEIVEWFSSDDCRGLDEIGLVAEAATRLMQIGLPIDRLVLHLMTLHPDVIGRTIAWAPRAPVEVYDRRNGSQLPAGSLRRVLESGELLMAAPDNRWEQLDIYVGRNLSQLVLAPMHSADGLLGVLVFGTSQAGGFAGAESDLLERIVQPLRGVVELKILKQTQLGLLDAYTGPANAGRIFARNMRRREIELVEGAMLLCELDIPFEAHELAGHLIDTLDKSRSVVVSSMKGHGAEIIELAADRILALFPAGGKSEVCERAIACASAISGILAIDAFSGVETRLAAHYGEIAYGGVEASTRLLVFGSDFKDLETLTRVSGQHGRMPVASRRLMEVACEGGAVSSGNLQIIDTDRLAESSLLVGA